MEVREETYKSGERECYKGYIDGNTFIRYTFGKDLDYGIDCYYNKLQFDIAINDEYFTPCMLSSLEANFKKLYLTIVRLYNQLGFDTLAKEKWSGYRAADSFDNDFCDFIYTPNTKIMKALVKKGNNPNNFVESCFEHDYFYSDLYPYYAKGGDSYLKFTVGTDDSDERINASAFLQFTVLKGEYLPSYKHAFSRFFNLAGHERDKLLEDFTDESMKATREKIKKYPIYKDLIETNERLSKYGFED